MRDGLLPISQEAMIAGSRENISYHVPSGPTQTNAQLDAIARDLGPINRVRTVLVPHRQTLRVLNTHLTSPHLQSLSLPDARYFATPLTLSN